MTGAMYAAIGGLKTHMSSLNVIGNNIANVNTNSYKAQRMTFQESIYTMSRAGSNGTLTVGGNNPSQVGYGCSVGSIDLNMNPSTYSPTGYGLDNMIMGEGFYVMGDKDMQINGSEDFSKFTLSRMGDFWVDPQGYITDRRGNCVFGFATVQNPNYKKDATEDEIAADKLLGKDSKHIGDPYIISTQLVPLRLPLAAAAPSKLNGGAEVDANGKVISTKWQAGDPVYGLMGKADETDFNSRDNVSVVDYMKVDPQTGEVKVGEDGKLPEGVGTTTGLPDAGQLDYSGPIPNTEDKCVKLTGMNINEQGGIYGTDSNGNTVVVGYIAIANCASNDGVTHEDGYYYKAAEGAGNVTINGLGGILDGKFVNNRQIIAGDGQNAAGGTPKTDDAIGKGGTAIIKNGGLEASSTDIATEFSNMILTQRGYQANTRIITVTDSMLEELVNMKRG